jgi:hypothetical protein
MAMSETAEMAALRQRFPKMPPITAAFQALTIVATNTYLLYLLLHDEGSPTAFALFGVLELVAWIANTALIPVPKELRVGSPDIPLITRITVIIAFSAFLLGIAWLSVPDREHVDQLLHAGNPLAMLDELHILWPLLASIAFAASGSFSDLMRWRQVGGPFVTGTAMAASGKFITAIVAPIAAAMLSGSGDAAHKAMVWSSIYLAIKSGSELLMLWWQSLGMPERQPESARKLP